MLATIHIRGKRIIVGKLEEGIFSKTVNKSQHLMRKFDAWGFDYQVLVDWVFPQATMVKVFDREEKRYYMTIPSVFGKLENGKYTPSQKVVIRHYKKGVDNRAQIFLPRRYWWKSGTPLSLEDITRRFDGDTDAARADEASSPDAGDA